MDGMHLGMSLENPRVLLTSVFFLPYCSHDLFKKKWLFGYDLGLNLVYLETKILSYSPSCTPA